MGKHSKISPEIYRACWERAKEEELGIAIPTSNPKDFRHGLLENRPDGFEELMTFCPAEVEEVFIVKKSAELPDA